jgi:hypothetical protein
MYMFSYLFCLYCHRVTAQLQLVVVVTAFNIISPAFFSQRHGKDTVPKAIRISNKAASHKGPNRQFSHLGL